MNGIVSWFARNSVAANLLMGFIVCGGLIGAFSVRAETNPEFSWDGIQIQVPYLGAAPEEVEEAVCIRIEEAIQGVNGVKKITSTASEGMATVMVEVETGANTRTVLDDIRSNVDAIDTFPELTEKPIMRELVSRNHVIDLAVSGDTDMFTLKRIGERIRNELSAISGISQVDLVSAPPYEISIEVSELALRRHGLTFDDVATAVRESSLDLPGGSVRAESGEVLLRTIGQAYRGDEYEGLVLLSRGDGTRLRIGDVATVVDGFAETDQFARFDGHPTVMVSVFRSGSEGTTTLANRVIDYVDRVSPTLPEGIALTVWQNGAVFIQNRLSLMGGSALAGFALVFLMLALFLELRLAVWVSLGIPVSFLGAVVFMPLLDVTMNDVSTFAFILVLGIWSQVAVSHGGARRVDAHCHLGYGAVRLGSVHLPSQRGDRCDRGVDHDAARRPRLGDRRRRPQDRAGGRASSAGSA